MELPICTSTSNRSCSSVIPTFTFSLFPSISTFPLPISRMQYLALVCLPSRPNDLLLLWLMTSFAEAKEFVGFCRGTAGLLPELLDTQRHAARFAHSLAVHRLSLPTLQPSSSACHKVVRLFCCVEELEDIATPVICVLQDVPLRDILAFWSQQTFHHLNIHYDLGAIFQIIFHCIHHPFSSWAPSDYRVFLVFSPPSITCRCRRILSPWRSFVFASRPLGHHEAQAIRAESLKNLRPLVSCFFQDSSQIHINIFWAQQFFQFFNCHFHTVTPFQVLFRSCNNRFFEVS